MTCICQGSFIIIIIFEITFVEWLKLINIFIRKENTHKCLEYWAKVLINIKLLMVTPAWY